MGELSIYISKTGDMGAALLLRICRHVIDKLHNPSIRFDGLMYILLCIGGDDGTVDCRSSPGVSGMEDLHSNTGDNVSYVGTLRSANTSSHVAPAEEQ